MGWLCLQACAQLPPRLTFATPALSLAAFCFLLPEIQKRKNQSGKRPSLQVKQLILTPALTLQMLSPWR